MINVLKCLDGYFYYMKLIYMVHIVIFHFGKVNSRINLFLEVMDERFGSGGSGVGSVRISSFNFFNKDDMREYKNLGGDYDGMIFLGKGGLGKNSCLKEYKKENVDALKGSIGKFSENMGPWYSACSMYHLNKVEDILFYDNIPVREKLLELVRENMNKPIYGICFGYQLLNTYYGGKLVRVVGAKNSGKADTRLDVGVDGCDLFAGLPSRGVFCDYNHFYKCVNGDGSDGSDGGVTGLGTAGFVRNIAWTDSHVGVVAKQFGTFHYGSHFHIIGSEKVMLGVLDNFVGIVQRNAGLGVMGGMGSLEEASGLSGLRVIKNKIFHSIEGFENDVKEKIKDGSLSGIRGASYILSIAVVGVVFFEVLKLRR